MISPELARLAAVGIFLAVLTGCSGSSSSATAQGDGDPTPPVQEPPGDGGSGDDGETPTQEPSVSFAASDQTVAPGDTTTLTWSSQGAGSCQASGGWSGGRPLSGSAVVGPLNGSTTFTLTCSGDGGSSMAMLSVSVLGTVSLAWQPPAQNEDGSPINDLSGFRIYYGNFSRSYDEEVTVGDVNATGWSLELPSGDYYFALTAFDAQGNESGYSNEVLRSVN